MKYLSLNKTVVEDTINKILFDKKEIIFTYIFGSIVKSEYFHDIDIAVYLDKNFNYRDVLVFPYGYESNLAAKLIPLLKTDKIHIIILNKADLHLFHNVISSGKLLFDKERLLRIKCENNIRKEFIDTNHIRRIKNYYLFKKIGEKCTI